VGGNQQLRDFLKAQNFPKDISIPQKYNQKALALYGERIKALTDGVEPKEIPYIGYTEDPLYSSTAPKAQMNEYGHSVAGGGAGFFGGQNQKEKSPRKDKEISRSRSSESSEYGKSSKDDELPPPSRTTRQQSLNKKQTYSGSSSRNNNEDNDNERGGGGGSSDGGIQIGLRTGKKYEGFGSTPAPPPSTGGSNSTDSWSSWGSTLVNVLAENTKKAASIIQEKAVETGKTLKEKDLLGQAQQGWNSVTKTISTTLAGTDEKPQFYRAENGNPRSSKKFEGYGNPSSIDEDPFADFNKTTVITQKSGYGSSSNNNNTNTNTNTNKQLSNSNSTSNLNKNNSNSNSKNKIKKSSDSEDDDSLSKNNNRGNSSNEPEWGWQDDSSSSSKKINKDKKENNLQRQISSEKTKKSHKKKNSDDLDSSFGNHTGPNFDEIEKEENKSQITNLEKKKSTTTTNNNPSLTKSISIESTGSTTSTSSNNNNKKKKKK